MLALVVALRLVFGVALLTWNVDALVLRVDVDHASVVVVVVARKGRRRGGGEGNSNGDGSAFHGRVLDQCGVAAGALAS